MAYEIPGQLITLPSSTNLSGHQFCFVNVSTAGEAVIGTSAQHVLGVLQNDPSTGQEAVIMINGVSKIKAASSTLHVGQYISCGTSGVASWVAVGSTVATVVGQIIGGSSGGARTLTMVIQSQDG